MIYVYRKAFSVSKSKKYPKAESKSQSSAGYFIKSWAWSRTKAINISYSNTINKRIRYTISISKSRKQRLKQIYYKIIYSVKE